MKAMPEFPKKRPIELGDKSAFAALFKKYPPLISEFTFTNLFAWRHAYRFCVSALEDFLLIISLKGDALHIFDPLGPADKKQAVIHKCLSSSLQGRAIKFIRLPEATAALFKGDSCFKVEEDRNNFDYLYLTRDLTEIKGKDFDGKRNFIKRFKERYSFRYKRITKANVKECLSFQEEWCLAKDCQRTEGLEREKEAMREMLENFESLGIQGGMLDINKRVGAVTLGEKLNPQTFVIHMEKANDSFIGIYQAVNQFFAADAAKDLKYINREQDLGVPGLRQAKESYHPCAMVKKYTLSR